MHFINRNGRPKHEMFNNECALRPTGKSMQIVALPAFPKTSNW